MAAAVTDEFQDLYVRPAKGVVLVVGSKVFAGRTDRRKLFKSALGLDMQSGEGVDIVHDLEVPLAGQYAHIDCVSILEHCKRPWLVAENIENLLVPGGTLFVSVPFVWRFHGYPSDYFRFTLEGMQSLFPRIEWVKTAYATDKLRGDPFLKTDKDGGYPMLPKSEVLGFGRRV